MQLLSFNPYRVFEYVATNVLNVDGSKSLSFNPYRVFEYVATADTDFVLNSIPQFQSLSGFRVRCNQTSELLHGTVRGGFNPYRVFEYVATVGHGRGRALPQSFNPYRVFEYVATG